MAESVETYGGIVIFIVDGDDVRRNFYMNLCQMIPGVKIFGFNTGDDAVEFTAKCIPDGAIVAYEQLCGMSGADVIRSLCAKNPGAPIAAIADVYNKSLEIEIRSAGAVSCFSALAHDDSLLYAVRSLADIAHNKKYPNKDVNRRRPVISAVDFIDIDSYSAANKVNKYAAAAALSGLVTDKLLYIRVFSFLYDFFVKCFLNDIKITAGVITDESRIIVAACLPDGAEKLINSAVFHHAAEKFLNEDGGVFCATLDLRGVSEVNFTYFLKENVIDTQNSVSERMMKFRSVLEQSAPHSVLFTKLASQIIVKDGAAYDCANLLAALSSAEAAFQEHVGSAIGFDTENFILTKAFAFCHELREYNGYN